MRRRARPSTLLAMHTLTKMLRHSMTADTSTLAHSPSTGCIAPHARHDNTSYQCHHRCYHDSTAERVLQPISLATRRERSRLYSAAAARSRAVAELVHASKPSRAATPPHARTASRLG